MAITHKKVATSTDDPAYEIQPSHWNDEHDGTNAHTHQSATEGGDLRASAAEVITGTDNTKFATPQAIKDAGIVPAISATGWNTVTGTWTYASATTITVPSGAGNIYTAGDRFMLTANAVVLQGYIVKVADTLLTVRGDTLTNHSFSLMFYSHMSTPYNYKDWYAYTPTGPTNVTLSGRFKIFGKSIHVRIKGFVTGAINWTNMPTLPLPVSSEGDMSSWQPGSYSDGGVNRYGKLICWAYPTYSVLYVVDADSTIGVNMVSVTPTTPITWSNGDRFDLESIYEWMSP